MSSNLPNRLSKFQSAYGFYGKGPLSVALHITRYAIEHGLPLEPGDLLAQSGTQVSGLGGARIKRILADHGIVRPFASEGGRTSRGSVDNMVNYVAFLNVLHEEGDVSLEVIEQWWAARVRDYFASTPLSLEFDSSLSFETMIRRLLSQAEQRQREAPGTTYVGTVLQHLVGAKLELLLEGTNLRIDHFGASVADGPTSRPGDFAVGDTVIHVTTAPGEALMQKCRNNISSGQKPIVVTLMRQLGMARGNAETLQIHERVEILAIEQFLTSNIYEHSRFSRTQQQSTVEQLIQRYNQIVDAVESDPSIRIHIGR